jgi:hypothetical protein
MQDSHLLQQREFLKKYVGEISLIALCTGIVLRIHESNPRFLMIRNLTNLQVFVYHEGLLSSRKTSSSSTAKHEISLFILVRRPVSGFRIYNKKNAEINWAKQVQVAWRKKSTVAKFEIDFLYYMFKIPALVSIHCLRGICA